MASAARKQAEEALRSVERERLVSGIREAAKFASRSERMVFLHDYEAKALVCLIDALRSLLAEPDGAGAEDCPDCGVTETATGWTLRRCDKHRIEMRYPAPSPASDEVREAADHLTGLVLEFCGGDCEDPEHVAARALRAALDAAK